MIYIFISIITLLFPTSAFAIMPQPERFILEFQKFEKVFNVLLYTLIILFIITFILFIFKKKIGKKIAVLLITFSIIMICLVITMVIYTRKVSSNLSGHGLKLIWEQEVITGWDIKALN